MHNGTDYTRTNSKTCSLSRAVLADILKSASDLTGSGTQMPFSAQQLAGLSEGQREAITRATQGVGAFQPFLQQGAEAVGQGIGQLGTAQQELPQQE